MALYVDNGPKSKQYSMHSTQLSVGRLMLLLGKFLLSHFNIEYTNHANWFMKIVL